MSSNTSQDLQDVLDHSRRRSDHLKDVTQPGEQFHLQQTLKHKQESQQSSFNMCIYRTLYLLIINGVYSSENSKEKK